MTSKITIGTLGERVDQNDKEASRRISLLEKDCRSLKRKLEDTSKIAENPHKVCGKAGEIDAMQKRLSKMMTIKWATVITLVVLTFGAGGLWALQAQSVTNLEHNVNRLDQKIDVTQTDIKVANRETIKQFIKANREMVSELKKEIRNHR